MALDYDALRRELMFLRKGPGVRHRDLTKRLGRETSALFSIDSNDRPAVARQKIASEVSALMVGAPAEAVLAVQVALGLRAEAGQGLLRDRVNWLAERLMCDGRTARRRIDDAFDHLVYNAQDRHRIDGEPPAATGPAWRFRAFRALLRLDTPCPEASEHRVIVALRDGMQRFVYPFSLYRAEGEPTVDLEAIQGVRLERNERPIPEFFQFHLVLPRPLNRGKAAVYELRMRVPAGMSSIKPQYIYTPVYSCDLFDLTIRFDPERIPRAVWALDAAVPVVVEHGETIGRRLEVDSFGEVNVQFRDLKTGLGYGIKWRE